MKKKLFRFAQVAQFPNVFEHPQTSAEYNDFYLKGNWHVNVFKNSNPLVLELGCGKGEYSVGMATEHHNKNFIGCDLKGNRIYVGAKYALDNHIDNVAFLRARIENIDKNFDTNEVSEIWITFPDPQPQKTRERKRLTHAEFLARYKKILKSDGIVHLKTDNEPLFLYSLESVKNFGGKLNCYTNNLYGKPTIQSDVEKIPNFASTIKTHYEKLFSEKGMNICYANFRI